MSITREEFEKAGAVSRDIPLLRFLSKHPDEAFSVDELISNYRIEIGISKLGHILRENYIQTVGIKDKTYVAITEKGMEAMK